MRTGLGLCKRRRRGERQAPADRTDSSRCSARTLTRARRRASYPAPRAPTRTSCRPRWCCASWNLSGAVATAAALHRNRQSRQTNQRRRPSASESESGSGSEQDADEEDDLNDRENAEEFYTLMKEKGYCFFFKTC